jgi:hypothetical protein
METGFFSGLEVMVVFGNRVMTSLMELPGHRGTLAADGMAIRNLAMVFYVAVSSDGTESSHDEP